MKIKILLIIFILNLLIAGPVKADAIYGICVCADGSCVEAPIANPNDPVALAAGTNYCTIKCTGTLYPTIADCAAFEKSKVEVGEMVTKAAADLGKGLNKIEEKLNALNYVELKQTAQTTLNPVGFTAGKAGVFQIMSKAINFFTGIAGMVAMILYIWAGLKWMSAAGNSESVSQAQAIIAWTTIGTVVILSSYILVRFLFDNILKIPTT